MKLVDTFLLLLPWCFTSVSAAPAGTAEDQLFKRERAISSKFKIHPKECTIERESDTGVCMFNYECYKKKGTVLGTCIDGFLFGACCRLPELINDGEEDIEEFQEEEVEIDDNNENVDKVVLNIESRPSLVNETPTFLSDLLSKSDLSDSDKEDIAINPTEASHDDLEDPDVLDSLELPLEIDNDIPSIILANGSVVSLDALSLKPALYEKTTEKSAISASTISNGLNHLFTWSDLDDILNTTSKQQEESSVTTSTSTTTSTTTTSSSSEVPSSTGSGSTQDLPFLEEFFNINLNISPISSFSTTTTTTQTTTITSTTSTTSTTVTSTTSTTTSTTPLPTTTTTTVSPTTKSTPHPIWPDPFLDLATQDVETLRPELNADNVNEHLDLFVSSILASINASIPELLDQLTTQSTKMTEAESSSKDPFEWVDDWNSNSVFATSPRPSQPTPGKAQTKAASSSTTTSTTTTTTTTTTSTTSTTVTSTTASSTSSTSTVKTTTEAWDYTEDCGVRPLRGQGRIVGGEKSAFGDWPWQVLVKESTWLGLFTKNKCGGVLISDRHVLTAAHCQPGFLASLLVELGEYDISGPNEFMSTKEQKVKRVVVHKDYKAPTFENDIAILELEVPIERQPHVVPICMPKDNNEEYLGRMGIVTGWGRLEYGGGVPNILHQVSVPVIDNDSCQEMFNTSGHKKKIRESFLCAGYKDGKKDSCEGDSGGPLMWQQEDGRWVLMGTVSHGIKCAYPNLPGVYMRMTHYKPWIEKVTGLSF